VKAGVLVSLIGLGLLIGEANRRGAITVTAEMVLTAVAVFGLALLLVGWHFRHQRPIYGLSLQGGGIAVLYLAIYAAFAGYDILSAPVALSFVVATTAGAGILAVTQDSRSMAVLGIIGGFLAPVLSYSEPGDHIFIFTFYAILNAAILGVAWFKVWPELNLLGFGFTFGVATFWLLHRYVDDDWSTAQPFIALFVAMYMVIPVLFAARKALAVNDVRYVSWLAPLVFGTPFIGFALQQIMVNHTEYGTAISASGLALANGALSLAVSRMGRLNRELSLSYAGLAVVFIALAVPFAFDAYYTSTVWTLQGALLVWVGCRKSGALTIGSGAALQILAGCALILHLSDELPYPDGIRPIANEFFLGTALLAITGASSGWFLHRSRERSRASRVGSWFALAWAGSWWLAAGLREIDYNLSASQLAASVSFAALSFWLAAWTARKVGWTDLTWFGILLLPVMAVALVVQLNLFSHPFGSYGWVAWMVMATAHYSFLLRYRDAMADVEEPLHVGGYWVLAVLVSAEVFWQVDRVADGVWPIVAAYMAALLFVSATLWGGRLLRWPLATHRRIYALSCAGSVLAGLSAAVLVTVLVSDGEAGPLRYIPVLNPLEMVAVLVTAAVVAWRGTTVSEEGLAFPPLAGIRGAPVLATAGTVLATMATVRTVHHWGDVPFDSESMFNSAALQTSLAILWALIALSAMVAGVRQAHRPTWIAGVSFMAVVVLKLFIVDFRDHNTVGRVVSFIAVGVLLVIVGYFAPAPPAASEAESQD
jgi:uncharacterized membrane protein